MLRLVLVFSTHDGHTAKISEQIASALGRADCAAETCDLARSHPQRQLESYDGVIVGGPLHGGNQPSQLDKFISENRHTLSEQPSAFFSVSLSAAGNEQQQGNATRCVNEFLEATNCQPDETTIVAADHLYRKHGLFKRRMMKMIVKRGGRGDTDTSWNCVYTDWDAVDDFANDSAGLLDSPAPKRTKTGGALIT